jgi:hypothetical protein
MLFLLGKLLLTKDNLVNENGMDVASVVFVT